MGEYSSVYAMLCVGRKFCRVAQKKKDRFLSRGAAEKAAEILMERYPNQDPKEAYYCKDKHGQRGCRLWHTATELPSAQQPPRDPPASCVKGTMATLRSFCDRRIVTYNDAAFRFLMTF